MTRGYVLTALAEADLRDLIRYSRKQWGEQRTRAYVTELEDGTLRLARSEGRFKDMSAIYPHLRAALVGRHYVFCLPRSDAEPIVVAFLNERMDILARLKNRLT